MFDKKNKKHEGEGLSKRPMQEIDRPPVVKISKLSERLTPKKKDIAPNA